mmetsp:Transcript_9062/g.15528  ORF Transcript_9062/g.15528 Transcript_9062/m.15528 type:complete len:124 (+) Transcript_9062:60-431(+)|eukprot:CAMPEP_0196651590 /NCGR_PEP_ID=MMETSP1086-20130531/604_1 /TAXON_ID=77921 /ORGANISM="Cyanoptyche  gloeocystis , Strain SAG4.97" /LENGTH=123 /DNA_ID=CAMNT_0041981677 /DNA_START=55 /DNA_END=426 /DNA_ORIENTATION=-
MTQQTSVRAVSEEILKKLKDFESAAHTFFSRIQNGLEVPYGASDALADRNKIAETLDEIDRLLSERQIQYVQLEPKESSCEKAMESLTNAQAEATSEESQGRLARTAAAAVRLLTKAETAMAS